MKEYINNCPVCGSNIKLKNYDICPQCGWESDLVQNEEETFPGGANKLSLIEYRYMYSLICSQIKNYKWDLHRSKFQKLCDVFKENDKCKCCGEPLKETIGEKCPKCGWISCYVQEHYTDVRNLINKESLQDQRIVGKKREEQ